ADRTITHAPGIETLRGQRIPVWPVWKNGVPRLDNVALDYKERQNGYIFACQQLLRPQSADTAVFPVAKCFSQFPSEAIPDLNVQLRVMSVDTASSTDPTYSNDTAISCAIVSDALMRVVVDGVCGLLTDVDILEALFSYHASFKPDIILIEHTQFIQGLTGQLREQEARRRIELPIEFIKRPRTISKKQRIQ